MRREVGKPLSLELAGRMSWAMLDIYLMRRRPRSRPQPKPRRKKCMPFKAEVIADDSGKWAHNALVFNTEQEAADYGRDLGMRWFAVRQTRAVATDQPATHSYINGKLTNIEQETTK